MICRIAVIGGGAWGSALAASLARNGHEVRLHCRREELAGALASGICPALENAALPGFAAVSTDLASILAEAEIILLALPARASAALIPQLGGMMQPAASLVLTAKGLVGEQGLLLPEIAASQLANPAVVLTGPSFADEVLAGVPTAMIAASHDAAAAARVAGLFSGSNIRAYPADDPIGAAIGGAMKNVIAIASGMISGLPADAGLGDNSRAALITRGLAEATRFALALGGRQQTLFGLAGIGDLVLSCSGVHSRNFAYGLALGQGSRPAAKLAEGRHAVLPILRRAEQHEVNLPISSAVAAVIHDDVPISEAIRQLWARPVMAEWNSVAD